MLTNTICWKVFYIIIIIMNKHKFRFTATLCCKLLKWLARSKKEDSIFEE
jgi:hypothetical protein